LDGTDRELPRIPIRAIPVFRQMNDLLKSTKPIKNL
jgi:hypothetical protein